MISIVVACSKSKQDMADITIPLWLGQKGVDFELVIATEDGLKLPEDKRIRRVPMVAHTAGFCLMCSMNNAIAAAKGDVLYMTQIDMEANNDHLLRNMLTMLRPDHMVSERFFKDGKRHSGLFLQALLVPKNEVVKAGGFDTRFCGLYAWEDTMLMARLLSSGCWLDFLIQDEEYATHHLPHPRPSMEDPDIRDRHEKARAVYDSEFKVPMLMIFYRQLLFRRRLGEKVNLGKVYES